MAFYKRELKFRAWNGEQMIYDSLNICVLKRFDHVNCMQFTGITNNFKEIYEGDIIKASNGKTYKVIFLNGCFMLSSLNGGISHFTDLERDDVRINVIGNIYENPNLF